MEQNSFAFKQFTVRQDHQVFPVGTDACLLASITDQSHTKNLLEIGCGTGVVSLMLAQRFPLTRITAIDINPFAVDLAQQNFDNSPWHDRLNAKHVSMKSFYQTSKKQFDSIIANPPFFKSSIKNSNTNRALARHDVEFSLKTFIVQGINHLSVNGKITLILPQNRREEYLEILQDHKIKECSVTHIKPFAHKSANRFISEASAVLLDQEPIIQDLILYNKPKEYSEQVQQLLRPFYLKL